MIARLLWHAWMYVRVYINTYMHNIDKQANTYVCTIVYIYIYVHMYLYGWTVRSHMEPIKKMVLVVEGLAGAASLLGSSASSERTRALVYGGAHGM